MKKCTECEEEKELSYFGKRKSKKDGLNVKCKDCINIYLKGIRIKNHVKILENQKRYRDNHKELIYNDNIKYRNNNKEKLFEINSRPVNKFKNKARFSAKWKISLVGKKCEVCGDTKFLQRHHNDYNKHLDITILCRNCHVKWHNENKVPEIKLDKLNSHQS